MSGDGGQKMEGVGEGERGERTLSPGVRLLDLLPYVGLVGLYELFHGYLFHQ